MSSNEKTLNMMSEVSKLITMAPIKSVSITDSFGNEIMRLSQCKDNNVETKAYNCPNCGAPLKGFSYCKCEYCGTYFKRTVK